MKCAISFHEWMDSYMAGLFGREKTKFTSTVFSNVTLMEWFLFLPVWLPSVHCLYSGQGDGVVLFICQMREVWL